MLIVRKSETMAQKEVNRSQGGSAVATARRMEDPTPAPAFE